jgi:phosphoribosylformylglycinamidine synthase II
MTQIIFKVDIRKKKGMPDPFADGLKDDIKDLGIDRITDIKIHTVYWLKGDIESDDAVMAAKELLCDPVVEEFNVGVEKTESKYHSFLIGFLPGVTDPAGASAERGIRELGIGGITQVKTGKRFLIAGKISDDESDTICDKLLMNKVIQRRMNESDNPFPTGSAPGPVSKIIPIRKLNSTELEELSKIRVLALNVVEMTLVQDYFEKLDRDPSDVELEALAQTWSEHCIHKTLKSDYIVNGKTKVSNLLKSTIVRATKEINHPMCVSVFEDNAGIIKFDEKFNICFKVETHNHPSAIEPYGGAGTGIGGVIRDILGCGLGAKPIANTDIFCFADPTTPRESLPPGTLHPKRVMKGVVAGVRDYGNRMGIPTVNGSVNFHPNYVGNPLVYCGTLGIMPEWASFGSAKTGDKVLVVGGATGRDGIHGATFSSLELDEGSEVHSSGAVQIGNPICEKKFTDVMLVCRDRKLYRAVTDCGAGGLSSAVGEMGEKLGAKVELNLVALKYEGLQPWEIWVSEAQERMVFAVPPENVDEMIRLFTEEDVDARVIGEFTNTNKLQLTYNNNLVCEVDMEFLHNGCPRPTKEVIVITKTSPMKGEIPSDGFDKLLLEILSHPDVASKEWVVRQYDHEVQGGSVVKPFVGLCNDGPSDASVIKPLRDSKRGIVIAHGISIHTGEYDPYQMAAHSIDEAVRNAVAVGADVSQMAILDNFAWGSVRDPESLGALYQACQACYDIATVYKTPFISGKDSLNNEYSFGGEMIQIPHTLMISSVGIIEDIEKTVTMDFKRVGSIVYIIGVTSAGLAGSYISMISGFTIGTVPIVNAHENIHNYKMLHEAISKGIAESCHDISDGGLACALAEMAFAGGHGVSCDLSRVPVEGNLSTAELLFGEAPGRLIVEVLPENEVTFKRLMCNCDLAAVGLVQDDNHLRIRGRNGKTCIDLHIDEMKKSWKKTLDW